jgi:uncharacterized membrane protein
VRSGRPVPLEHVPPVGHLVVWRTRKANPCMSTWKRWQDWANVVLGVLLFIAPFVFGGMAVPAAAWTAYIGGALLVIVGLYDLASPDNRMGQWVEGVIGVLLFIAPWALGFTALTAMAWSAWIIGVLSVILAATVLFGQGTEQRRMVSQH